MVRVHYRFWTFSHVSMIRTTVLHSTPNECDPASVYCSQLYVFSRGTITIIDQVLQAYSKETAMTVIIVHNTPVQTYWFYNRPLPRSFAMTEDTLFSIYSTTY